MEVGNHYSWYDANREWTEKGVLVVQGSSLIKGL